MTIFSFSIASRAARFAYYLPKRIYYVLKSWIWDAPVAAITRWKVLKISDWKERVSIWKEQLNIWYLNKPVWDVRKEEYEHALKFIAESRNILDVACGTGTFLEAWPHKGMGIDINPENVAYCKERGLDVVTGSALDLPFADNSFDGVHCSHLMQVFMPDQGAQLMRELCRVVKDDGVVVISTLNWFKRFFRHPENARPYPPDAILRLNQFQSGATSPMYTGMPTFKQEGIWLRRPPLIEFFSVRPERDTYLWKLNPLQMSLGIRKFWAYDAYIIKLRVSKPAKSD